VCVCVCSWENLHSLNSYYVRTKVNRQKKEEEKRGWRKREEREEEGRERESLHRANNLLIIHVRYHAFYNAYSVCQIHFYGFGKHSQLTSQWRDS
jgi:hypothetical protein